MARPGVNSPYQTRSFRGPYFLFSFALIFYWYSSAYEVKDDCCLFERLFRVKSNGVFLAFWSVFFGFGDIDDFELCK